MARVNADTPYRSMRTQERILTRFLTRQKRKGSEVKPNSLISLVRQAGLEPATYGLEGRCSIQLSY